jgi:hypothetical protein
MLEQRHEVKNDSCQINKAPCAKVQDATSPQDRNFATQGRQILKFPMWRNASDSWLKDMM